MTLDELKIWVKDFAACFPALGEKIVKATGPKNSPARLDLYARWLETLARYDLDLAVTANKLMLAGKEPSPDSFDISKIPTHVAKVCDAIARRTRGEGMVAPDEREASRQISNLVARLDAGKAEGEWSAVEAFRAACEMYGSGATRSEVAAMLDARCTSDDPERQPRYRCLECRDRGRVTCWHPHAMLLARHGKLTPEGGGRYWCSVPCSCEAGEAFATVMRGGVETAVPRYSPTDWLKCERRDEGEVAELVAFMENYGERRRATRTTEWIY